MDGLTDGIVAPERERHIGDTTGDQRAGQVLLDPAGCLDVVDAVVGVLLDAGRNGEAVGIEDDVLGREPDILGEDVVRPLADLLAAFEVVGLAVLVEGHHDDRGTVLAAQAGLADELLDALLQGDRVDDRLALHALEPGLDDVPLRRVDHRRDPADVGLGGDQLGEAVHGGDAVDHALVHVDVDHLGTRLDLLSRHRERGGVVAGLDQVAETRRTGDVRTLADIDEQGVLDDAERLETGQPQGGLGLDRGARRLALDGLRDRRDVRRRGAAATADQVDEPALGELRDDRGGLVRRLVVLTERIGQSRVGIARDEGVGDP